eukprot:Platyproteum_vivax@DN3161_c0_g1_i1.p1
MLPKWNNNGTVITDLVTHHNSRNVYQKIETYDKANKMVSCMEWGELEPTEHEPNRTGRGYGSCEPEFNQTNEAVYMVRFYRRVAVRDHILKGYLPVRTPTRPNILSGFGEVDVVVKKPSGDILLQTTTDPFIGGSAYLLTPALCILVFFNCIAI